MSRTLFDGQNKQTEYESKLAICEHAGESTVPKELTSFSAPPLHKGGNLLANLQLRVFVSPFYQMARRVRCVDSRVQISFWMLAGESPVGTKEGPVP